jgi:hypothetical protein
LGAARNIEGEIQCVDLLLCWVSDRGELDLLQRIYRSAKQPMSRRMRAAIEAMPHEHPRLGAVATASMNGHDFAAMLDKAIERSGIKLIELIIATTFPRSSLPACPRQKDQALIVSIDNDFTVAADIVT